MPCVSLPLFPCCLSRAIQNGNKDRMEHVEPGWRQFCVVHSELIYIGCFKLALFS